MSSTKTKQNKKVRLIRFWLCVEVKEGVGTSMQEKENGAAGERAKYLPAQIFIRLLRSISKFTHMETG